MGRIRKNGLFLYIPCKTDDKPEANPPIYITRIDPTDPDGLRTQGRWKCKYCGMVFHRRQPCSDHQNGNTNKMPTCRVVLGQQAKRRLESEQERHAKTNVSSRSIYNRK